MAVKLIIAQEAQQDMEEAYGWFEERRAGLGEDFLTCVDACIQNICRMPELYAKIHEEYRRALVRRFPYAVFYEFSGGRLLFTAFFIHLKIPKSGRFAWFDYPNYRRTIRWCGRKTAALHSSNVRKYKPAFNPIGTLT